jgi:hypothetical protein
MVGLLSSGTGEMKFMFKEYHSIQGDLMTKEELLEIITKLLKTDVRLDFLLRLELEELKVLVASIRDRIGQVGQ